MSQLRLEGLDPPQQVKLAEFVRYPRVWVESVTVLRRLEPGPEHVVREVSLRRGLNVIWAPPRTPDAVPQLFQDGLPGHTAGKTTLARLIRHLLGEPHFAAEAVRTRIRKEFAAGWVVGLIHLAGEPWLVARPFAIGAHPFAVRSGDVAAIFAEDKPRLPLDDYLEALEEATVASLEVGTFPEAEAPIQWGHILPWLTRDQECAFAQPLDWRHARSGADSPSLTTEERGHVTRAVLGLISSRERDEQAKNVALLEKKRHTASRAPLLRHQARVDRERVAKVLGVSSVDETDLFRSQAREKLNERKGAVEARLRGLREDDPRPDAQETLDDAVGAEGRLRERVDQAKARLAAAQRELEQARNTKATASMKAVLAALPPTDDYCRVPMQIARENGCPLAESRPTPLDQVRALRSMDEIATHLENEIGAHEVLVAKREAALDAARNVTFRARQSLLDARIRYERGWEENRDEVAVLAQCEVQVDHAQRAHDDAVDLESTLKEIEKDITSSHERQKQLRARQAKALGLFSARFDYVVRALIGDAVRGEVGGGRALDLVIEHRGERQSAALDAVKTIALDIAALTHAIEGKGWFPLFLLHDGPRAADMAEDIYGRIFQYVRVLEDCFEAEPAFQYIITTTTEPPAEIQQEPWLRLELGAVPPERRLLGVDL